jgi:hypothetical protein
MTEILIYAGILTGFLSSRYAKIPVAARSKAWFCCRRLAGDCGFEIRRKHVCLYLLNVVWYQVGKSLRPADYLSRGVLPCVVCLRVIVKP